MAESASGRAYYMSVGVIFLGAFGAVWLTGGVILAGWAKLSVLASLAAGAALLLGGAFVLRRRAVPDPASAESERVGRIFVQVNMAQYVAMALAVIGANLAGRRDLIPVLISCIVALHFLPLARLFNNPVYFVTTPAIIMLDGLAVLRHGHQSAPAAAVATGVVLWCTAVFQLARGFRAIRAIGSGPAGEAYPSA
jgi:hypothetical protein